MDSRVIERGNIMYKLIAFDCDGTLLNDQKQIDKETIEVIKKVKDRGVKIVLATSKSFYRIKNYLYKDGFEWGGVFAMNPSAVKLTDAEYADMIEKIKQHL